MTTPPALRGRAATPVRPGFAVKSVLLGETPLATGEYVHEAAITDLHSAYKELIRQENEARPKARRLRGMTAQSFKTLFKFAQLLDLVELVREEPMKFPPASGNLYSIRKTDGEPRTVISTRRIFKITPVGAEDEKSWTNLSKAWTEGWSAPQKAEYMPPPFVTRAPREKPPVEEVVVEFTPYVWNPTPSDAEFVRLSRHLQILDSLGLDSLGVTGEVATLSSKTSTWIMEIDEALDEVKSIQYTAGITRYTRWMEHVVAAKEALLDQDLPRAMSALRELIR